MRSLMLNIENCYYVKLCYKENIRVCNIEKGLIQTYVFFYCHELI